MDVILASTVAVTVVLTGVLAPASPGVLEAVEDRRIRHGWGLDERGPEDAVRIAVDDCDLLGTSGHLVAGGEVWPVYVVDCTNAEHTRLEDLGLVADVNASELGHKEAIIFLQPERQ